MRTPKGWIEHWESDTEYSLYIEKGKLIIWFQGSSIKGFRAFIDWMQNLNFFGVKTDLGIFHGGLWRKYMKVRQDVISFLTNRTGHLATM